MDLPIAIIRRTKGNKSIVIKKIVMNTILLHEKAANIINSTASGPRVAVKLEPNVCVVKSKAL